MSFNVSSNSPQQTIEFGRRIGAQLRGGEIIAVCGQLGTGKTHLIKGIASGAGAEGNAKDVNSPTFIIVNQYQGRFDIYHIDAYRLKSIAEFEMIGFDDFCYPQSIVVIEWADKIEPALKSTNYIRIELFHAGQRQRNMHVENILDYIRIPDDA